LQWAVPVIGGVDVAAVDGPIIAVSDEGADIRDFELPVDAVLAFGTERQGLSPQMRQRVTATVSLPMQPGVSSLNLATSVSAVLYWWRLNYPR
jgi:tRNA G18 (ribose-2'-O)-methylase SpoU